MRIHLIWLKLCFAVTLLAACCGCQTEGSNPKKLTATLRLQMEVNIDTTGKSSLITVLRQQPTVINVEKGSFLDERYVTNMVVVDVVGGFALKVQFDTTGANLLQQYSTSCRGQRCAIFSRFGEKTFQERWLAAPVFNRTIQDGTLLFTPDATREEADQIARGVLNLKKQIVKKGMW